MKIRVKRKDGGMTVDFRAETSEDGVALKDAVLAAAKKGLSVEGILAELERHYEVASVAQTVPKAAE